MKRSTPMKRGKRIARTEFKRRIRLDAAKNSIGYGLSTRPRGRTVLSARGPKAKLRESINRQLRLRFRAMGLYDVCEARLADCWNIDLTWAHGRKDRELSMNEREFLVIRCCTVCHRILDEDMSHEGMLEFVETVIANRKKVA